jgi:aryl-alcohol dehydrogenase-like predicted oxidoreductase
MALSDIPLKAFGRTGTEVTVVGLGGEGVLRTHGRDAEAAAVISEAISQGITYFDCARVYAGSEDYYGSVWRSRPDARALVFQASKSASRSRDEALADLDRTLHRLGVEYLDLWQIHDVRTEEDLALISGRGGALEAFLEAKSAGRVRAIGVTGHHDPSILTRAVGEWPLDSVMMPVNPVEGALGGFLEKTLPAAREKGMAVIAMKVLGAGHYVHPKAGITADMLIRFALSQPVNVVIVGCSNPEEVKVLAKVGRGHHPLSPEEQEGLIAAFGPVARRLAFYRGVF